MRTTPDEALMGIAEDSRRLAEEIARRAAIESPRPPAANAPTPVRTRHVASVAAIEPSPTLEDQNELPEIARLALEYVSAGLALTPVHNGSKKAFLNGWNRRRQCITTPDRARYLRAGGVGLAHAYCAPGPTCALDVDDFDTGAAWLAERGIDLVALLADPNAVQICGRTNRAKLLYRLPRAMVTVQPAGAKVEFRCATAEGLTVQDVLPPTVHENIGKPYEWVGDFHHIPEIPPALAAPWASLEPSRRTPRLERVESDDPVLARLGERGMVKADLGGGKFSIVCPFESSHTGPGGATECVYWLPNTGGYARGHFKCQHAHCTERSREAFLAALGLGGSRGEPPEDEQPEPAPAGAREPDADELEVELGVALTASPTEDNVALAFALANRGRLRFNHRRKRWHEWDGTRWREETTELALEFARRLARRANPDGKSGPARSSFMRGVETLARGDRVFALRGDELDRDSYLLNTPAGTIDLRSGEMGAHRREDLITMSTTVAPARSERPVFTQFLDEITCGDAALAEYLQRALGACLSGAPEDHWLLFWYGLGRNGKNTLGELVMRVMGDYAKKIPAQTLMRDYHGNRHPTEIANLAGVRLAFSSEVSEGDYWNESRIKELTGDAMLAGRFMRADFFEFPRTHKHIVYGNHRPSLRGVDPAIMARLHMVPFGASFTAEAGNLDITMSARLAAEGGGVLQWLIEGHAKWREDGTLRPCAAVAQATKEYFESQSSLDAWIEERCEIIKNDERGTMSLDRADKLYRDYNTWKSARGEHAMSQTRWGEQMLRRFTRIVSDGVRYRGLRLRPEPAP